MSPEALDLLERVRELLAARPELRAFEAAGEVADAMERTGASREALFEARLELAAAMDEDLLLQSRG